jgi:hypothetical protein
MAVTSPSSHQRIRTAALESSLDRVLVLAVPCDVESSAEVSAFECQPDAHALSLEREHTAGQARCGRLNEHVDRQIASETRRSQGGPQVRGRNHAQRTRRRQRQRIAREFDQAVHPRALVVSSTRRPDDRLATCADPVRSQRTIHRGVNHAGDLVMEGESYRPELKPNGRS